MPRVVKVLAAGDRPGRIVDTLLLNFDQRRLQQGFVFGAKGTCVELDFPAPVRLSTDDALLLDDGTLVEVRMAAPAALARLAWMLGDRHVPAQILANRLRVRRTPEIEAFLAEAGARTSVIIAPFEPDREPEAHAHDHGHDHDEGHDHDHGHDRHGHDHGGEADDHSHPRRDRGG